MNKDKIRNSFWGEFLISCLHIVECKVLPKVMDDETAVKKFFKKKAGYDLNLDNPRTYSEKLNWYKLNARNPLMAQCADKVAVREYVTEKGYGDMLNEIYGVYDKVSEIDIDALPEQFVLKAAHGSHMNLIVTDKSKINWRQQKMLMSTWLKQDIYWSGREWVYKDLPKRIVAEKYLEDESGELKDYKFFCFNGKAEYMEYDTGRFCGIHYRNFYDENMKFVPIDDGCPNDETISLPISKEQFDKMKSIANDLSQPFLFARIDFYSLGDKLLFGEITFFDSGGFEFFNPKEYDYEFSKNWELIKNP